MASVEKLAPCPQCNGMMFVSPEYCDWCPECDYNLNPDPDELSKLAAFRKKLGEIQGEAIFKGLMNEDNPKPKNDKYQMVAGILALMIYSLTLAIAALGIYLAIFIGSYFAWIGSVTCALAVLVLLPRPLPLSDHSKKHLVQRENFPQLFDLVDKVSRELGTTVDTISLDYNFNAFATTYGFGKKHLSVGVPLALCLDRQEFVAVLGHEIGHLANRDVSSFQFFATRSFFIWFDLLHVRDGSPDDGIVDSISKYLMTILSYIPLWLGYFMIFLDNRYSQRAEYLADLAGLKVSGGLAAIKMTKKLYLGRYLPITVQRHVLNNSQRSLLEQFFKKIDQIPESERMRVERVSLALNHSLDATHPPNGYRTRFLQRFAKTPPKIILEEDQWQAILKEFSQARAWAEDSLKQKFLASIYD